jgi:hypothetical protein
VDLGGADLLGRVADAEGRFDQRRPGHSHRAAANADQQITHSGQVRLAGKGDARDDADRRNQAREAGEDDERRRLATRREEHVVRASAAAIKPADHRQPPAQRVLEHARHLHVVDRALGPGVDGVVVEHEVGGETADSRRAHHQTVGGTGHSLAGRLRQAAVLDEGVRIGERVDHLAHGQPAALALAFDRSRTREVELRVLGAPDGGEIAPDALCRQSRTAHGTCADCWLMLVPRG